MLHYIIILVIFILATPASAGLRIVDGDTLEHNSVTYRIHGIDAPETAQRCGEWACGLSATDALADLVRGAQVECHAVDQDRYGRTIGVCFADGQDVGAVLVRSGLAWAFARYSEDYVREEREARREGRGIWGGDYPPAWEWRAQQRAEREQAYAGSGDCLIKGNITRSGEKIYHVPNSRWYSRTRISAHYGERWFCSEAEARTAGWRKAR